MRRSIFWILLILGAGLVIAAVLLSTAYYLIFGSETRVHDGTVVEITLGSTLETLPSQNILSQLLEGDRLSLWELGQIFRYASRDERVTAIYLEVHPLLLSWAQVEELRDHIRLFRGSGKPVHAFLALDMLRDQELYLASAADSITLNPDAGLLVNGLVAELTFFKGLMDKLGIRPQFIQFKEYKSAETYTRERMTPEIRGMYESLLKDIEDRFKNSVAEERKVDTEALSRLLAEGVAPAGRALDEGLVDFLGYKSEVLDRLWALGEDPEEHRSLSGRRYLNASRDRFRTQSTHRVALLGGSGVITSGRSDPFSQVVGGMTVASLLGRIREDDDLEGVIFWIDSPGGSAVGSDMVWKEVVRLQQEDKPVVVAMSGVAGSGGYYVSMAAERIVSQPSTITGSIGVIFGKFDLEPLYNWLGVTIDRVKTSPSADIFSASSSLTDEQLERLEAWMEDVYERFVREAAAGRGLTYEEMEPKARGRIYTGIQAEAEGLVDAIGGLDTAVAQMKEVLGLAEEEEIELVLYPPPRRLWDILLRGDLAAEVRSPSWSDWLGEQMPFLSRTAPWLLMPDARID